MSTGICWFRNDLRLDDNEVLLLATREHATVVPVYYLDTRLFAPLPELDFRKTGIHRAAFLLECLHDLRERLRLIGGDLLVGVGNDPAGFLRALAARLETKEARVALYFQREAAPEEMEDEAAVRAALSEHVEVFAIWGKTLYHEEDIPFEPNEIPRKFRDFRKPVEKESNVRKPLEGPEKVVTAEQPDWGEIPDLKALGFQEQPAPAFPGGETAALARLVYYLDESHLIRNYRRTRNLSLGADYSSKFSAYLATGCLSPRRVYAEVKRYGEEHKNGGGNSLLFEMRWRDFFIFLLRERGSQAFRPGGAYGKKHDWSENREWFDNWRRGETGLPFVDAHMRQLDRTGFMSNRGRVNCASFLTRDYRIDWRWGAAWFENRLIDYEVSANWLNWSTQALDIYYTSAPWQGLKYDRDGTFVKTWLPELEPLPAPLIHAPWKMEEEGMLKELNFDLERDYYRPRVENSKWAWAWGRLKTGDASSPRRRKK